MTSKTKILTLKLSEPESRYLYDAISFVIDEMKDDSSASHHLEWVKARLARVMNPTALDLAIARTKSDLPPRCDFCGQTEKPCTGGGFPDDFGNDIPAHDGAF